MNYPLISEYIDAILSPEDNFEQLNYLRPVFDDDGQPIMSSGNFAVVFKMTDGTKFYAVKCFLKDQPQRGEYYSTISNYLNTIENPYIVPFKYFNSELFVDSQQCKETEFPIVLMEWIEGKPINEYFNQCLFDDDITDKRNRCFFRDLLRYNFFIFFKWMVDQPFAHGDLKPDNILIKPDGQLVLIDYDGMFVPAMHNWVSIENGTPNYRNPKSNAFNRHIDDFALVSIMLSLLCSDEEYTELTIDDYYDLPHSKFGNIIFSKLSDVAVQHFMALYLLMQSSSIYLEISNLDITLETPKWNIGTEKIICDIDQFGVIYSLGYTRLLYFPIQSSLEVYKIKDDCIEITDGAFVGVYDPDPEFGMFICGNKLQNIILPKKLQKIGVQAFFGCSDLKHIDIPDSVSYIGDRAFEYCKLTKIDLPKSLDYLGLRCFPSSIVSFSSQSSNYIVATSIEGTYYLYHKDSGSLIRVHQDACEFTIPTHIKIIESEAFGWCSNLSNTMMIPLGVIKIKKNAFWGSSIRNLVFESYKCQLNKESLQVEHTWGRKYIEGYRIITSLTVPYGRKEHYLNQLKDTHVTIKEKESILSSIVSQYTITNEITDTYGVTYNEDWTVLISAPRELKFNTYKVHPNTKVIHAGAFCQSSALKEIILPEGLIVIEDDAFNCCYDLSRINMPKSLLYIGNFAFATTSLKHIELPPQLSYVGSNPIGETTCKLIDGTYNRYIVSDGVLFDLWTDEVICCGTSNSQIELRPETKLIREYAFWGQDSIDFVNLKDNISEIMECAFYGCHNLEHINVPSSLNFIGWAAFGETNLHQDIEKQLVNIRNDGSLFNQIEDVPF